MKYMKDIFILKSEGIINKFGNIAEIGPGDTLGVGFCALLDGFSYYYALDKIEHSEKYINLKILKELKQYFQNKKEIFNKIEEDILLGSSNTFKYIVPWDKENLIKNNSIDLIISNAVMEHIVDLKGAYFAMYQWLKPGGYASHIIDYRAHEFSDNWYEHFYLNDTLWKFLMHGRMYPINRYPHSFHIKTLKEIGFEIILTEKNYGPKGELDKVNKKLRKYFDEGDLEIISARIIVRKSK